MQSGLGQLKTPGSVHRGELEEQSDRLPPELVRHFTRKFESALAEIRVPDRAERIGHVARDAGGGWWAMAGGPIGVPRIWTRVPGRGSLGFGAPPCRTRVSHGGDVVAAAGRAGELFVIEMPSPGMPRVVHYDTGC